MYFVRNSEAYNDDKKYLSLFNKTERLKKPYHNLESSVTTATYSYVQTHQQ